MNVKELPPEIRAEIDPELAKPTRVHPIARSQYANLWIKREDELSSGISGGKLRKYASLIPYLKRQQIDTVGMIGGPNSNNLVGLAQLLRENGISPLAFLREAADPQLRGNALLLALLLAPHETETISRRSWDNVEGLARQRLQNLEKQGSRAHLLLEGCYGFPALLGTLTLPEDILRNERDCQQTFPRIYIDCGTGLSAIGLILGLERLLGSDSSNREVVVTLIAETESGFLEKLAEMRACLEKAYPVTHDSRVNIRFLQPILSPKFGSISKALFDECRTIARETGLIMDPTYSVKHFAAAAADHNKDGQSAAPSLFVFNGSALGICGFQDKLANSVNLLESD